MVTTFVPGRTIPDDAYQKMHQNVLYRMDIVASKNDNLVMSKASPNERTFRRPVYSPSCMFHGFYLVKSVKLVGSEKANLWHSDI